MTYPVIYLTLGYPTESKFLAILRMLDRLGVKAVEVGVPDADPSMDGKTIRDAHEEVMKRDYSTDRINRMLADITENHAFETILMGYHQTLSNHAIIGNPRLSSAHILCVDRVLTLSDHPRLIQLYHSDMELGVVHEKLQNNTLFAYFMANRNKTGIKLKTDDTLKHSIGALKEKTSLPVHLGFGIKAPEDARKAGDAGADGIIIGSEFVRRSAHDSIDELKRYVIEMGQAFTDTISQT